jgi:hypothetical protein
MMWSENRFTSRIWSGTSFFRHHAQPPKAANRVDSAGKMRPGGDPFTRKTTMGPRQHDIKMNFSSILLPPVNAL